MGQRPCPTCRASQTTGCLGGHRELSEPALGEAAPDRSQHVSGESYCTHFTDGSDASSLENKWTHGLH